MTEPICLADQCINKGLQCLEEAVEFYWPAKVDRPSGKFYPVAENNIALHLARSFTGNGFRVWAEVPSVTNSSRLDFFAYCEKKNVCVALELKRSIDMPPSGSLDDLKKLVDLHYGEGLANADTAINSAKWVYGIVTVFYTTEFLAWWEKPESYDYEKNTRYLNSQDYKQIGKCLPFAHRNTVPFKKWDNVHFVYALYDENSIGEIQTTLSAV